MRLTLLLYQMFDLHFAFKFHLDSFKHSVIRRRARSSQEHTHFLNTECSHSVKLVKTGKIRN